MKYFILFALAFTGCSTMSEYNRGCRDGIMSIGQDIGLVVHEDGLSERCDYLDAKDQERISIRKYREPRDRR